MQQYNTWLVLCFSLLISACANQKISTKSSVMEYLYPNANNTFVEPSTPSLKLPLRVGIAFVPESRNRDFTYSWSYQSKPNSLTEAKKSLLLNQVASHFKALDFVSHIEVIPSAYLTPKGSFTNLSQIKTMYGIDVIALVSYDQVQFTDESFLALSYWTIVGAYLVSGEKNDTSTLMDTVVYDIDSQKMLFRAPGTSQVQGRSTPINLSEELRTDSTAGFELATQQMITNLGSELSRFKQSLKDNPEQAKISYRDGYTGGGGALGFIEIILLMFIALGRKKLMA